MWSSASGNSASPHCSTMKPICATVDQASEVLTAGWVSMTRAPNSAVKPPTIASAASTPGAASIRSAKRMSRKPPALITPACSRAETGVGASMTSVSQPWVGNCADFSTAASASRAAAARAAQEASPLRASALIAAMSVVPKLAQTRPAARSRAPAPTVEKSLFLRAARRAAARSG
jgi:hypothetical protein